VLLLDVVLGYGSHPDPAAEIVPALAAARAAAERSGRAFICVGHICGTAGDPQDLGRQTAALQATGMILADSNAQAVRIARAIASRALSAQHA
jgi:FdrA protein